MADAIADVLLGMYDSGTLDEGTVSDLLFEREDALDFWETAGLSLSFIQMVLYLVMMYRYQEKLREYAGKLSDWANETEEVYKEFRELDPEFYDYYKNLPEYEVCDSAVERNRGEAWRAWGASMRASMRTTRGYTPLTNAHINHLVVDKTSMLDSVAMRRANALITERHRVNTELLEKWSAIVSSPVNVESYGSGAMGAVIKDSFKSMTNFGQGFNSAGSAFGTQLYRILD